jgi:hypothetical protein
VGADPENVSLRICVVGNILTRKTDANITRGTRRRYHVFWVITEIRSDE